jgi:hypothetical protein
MLDQEDKVKIVGDAIKASDRCKSNPLAFIKIIIMKYDFCDHYARNLFSE